MKGGAIDRAATGAADRVTAAAPLTPRQLEVTALLVDGRSNGEIADAMGISLDAVKEHVAQASIRAGLPEGNRVRLAVWFTRREAWAAWASRG